MKTARLNISALCLLLFSTGFANVYTVDNFGWGDNLVAYTASDGTNTWMKVMRLANNNPGLDTIRFSAVGRITFAVFGGADRSFDDPVLIDGSSAPGYAFGSNMVTIDANDLNDLGFIPPIYLTAGSDGSIVKGICAVNSATSGIHLNNSNGSIVLDCISGMEDDGVTINAHSSYGIQLAQLDSAQVINCISSGNTLGITIEQARYCSVTGCNFGLDITQTLNRGNSQWGALIQVNSKHNTIDSCIISYSQQRGVVIKDVGTDSNTVNNCIIGLNPAKNADYGNALAGVALYGGTEYNTISNCIISGNNQDGISVGSLVDGPTHNNTLSNNIIGLNGAANVAIGNSAYGIAMLNGSSGNILKDNIISGNGFDGVYVSNGDNNTFDGNHIGLNGAGDSSLPNGQSGIEMTNGSDGNIIRNCIISGNTAEGIRLDNCDTSRIYNNYIGTDLNGLTDQGNGTTGLVVANGSDRNVVSNNVISGNNAQGVYASNSNNNLYRGNTISMNATGTGSLPNASYGFELVNTSGDTIRNCVVSACLTHGIFLNSATNGTIDSCTIGMNLAGTVDHGNTASGINLSGTTSNLTIKNSRISGNDLYGIFSDGTNSNVTISNNYIGLNTSGTSAIANNESGVGFLNLGPFSNYIFNDNVISGNLKHGVSLDGTCSNFTFTGNYVGTNAAGDAAIGNTWAGIYITENRAIANVTIGGAGAGDGNVISGNQGAFGTQPGLRISGTNISVFGNHIGLSADGLDTIPNIHDGIFLLDADNVTIGGNGAGQRNVISGNHRAGIWVNNINGAPILNIIGNYIGTNKDGVGDTAMIGNGEKGIIVQLADSVVIQNNVISANGRLFWQDPFNTGHDGIRIETSVTDCYITGNIVGLGADGITTMGNQNNGIHILNNVDGVRIGGTGTMDKNVVSGNLRQNGILIDNSDNVVLYQNYCGTDSTGTSAKPNKLDGINIANASTNIIVGGSGVREGNVLSGNTNHGLYAEALSSAISIKGNHVGIGADGSTQVANQEHGIYITGCSAIDIGGNGLNERNIISGNTKNGLYLHTTDDVDVFGNYAGIAADGTTPVPNGLHGMELNTNVTNYTIGGLGDSANVMSGNTGHGIQIYDCNAASGSITGNYIGLNALGTDTVGNGQSGLIAIWSDNLNIGGPNDGLGNYIGGNGEFGIHFVGGIDCKIYNNKVGVGTDGSDAGNKIGGIFIQGLNDGVDNGYNNIIGGSGAKANIIAYNKQTPVIPATLSTFNNYDTQGTGFGIMIAHDQLGDQNPISQNALYCNAGLGIDLNLAEHFQTAVGLVDNNVGSGNKGKPAPVIHPYSTTDTIYGTAEANDTIEIFYNGPAPAYGFAAPSCDCEARVYLTKVTANASGNWGADLSGFSITDSSGLSATATNALANTSQICPCCRSVAGDLVVFTDTVCEGDTMVIALQGQVGNRIRLMASLNAGPYVALDSTSINMDTVVFKLAGLTAGAYNFRVYAQSDNSYDGSSCYDTSAAASAEVFILPVADAGADSSVCLNQNMILIGNGGGTYLWHTGETTASISVNPLVGETFTLTVTSAAGCTDTDDMVITIDALPTPNAGADSSICMFQSINVTGTGGGTYAWSTGETSATVMLNPVTDSIYTLTVTNAAGCTQSDDLAITIDALPTANAGADSSICPNESLDVVATGGGNYVWSTGETTPTVTLSPLTDSTYTLTVTNAAGCTDRDDLLITIDALPTADAGADSSICLNQSFNATASGGASYLWSTGESTSTITLAPLVDSVFTVTVTNAAGCIDTDDLVVTIDTLPVADAGADSSICLNDGLDLVGQGGGIYAWSNGGTTATVSVAPLADTTFTLTVTNAMGCTAVDFAVITVDPLPAADAGSAVTTCAGLPVTLQATGGVTYLWSHGPTADTTTVYPVSTTTYTVTTTSSDNCSLSDAVIVSIELNITAYAGEDDTICLGESANLTGNGAIFYYWSQGDSVQTISVSPIATTTYTLTASSGGSCSDADTVIVRVNALPTADAGNHSAICLNQQLTLSGLGAAGGSYLWSPETSLNDSSLAAPVASPTITTSYQLLATDSNGCTNTDSVTVTVHPLPTAVAGSDTAICLNDGITLNGSGGASYLWSPETSLNDSSLAAPIASPMITTSYQLMVTDTNGCINMDSITITVYGLPTADAGKDDTICLKDSIMLLGSGPSYLWSPAASVSDPSLATPWANPSVTTTYTLIATDTNSCTASNEVVITVNPLPTVTLISDKDTLCSNSPVTLTASGGDLHAWNNPALDNLTELVQPASTTNYIVTLSNNLGCTNSNSLTVVIHPIPSIAVRQSSPKCQFEESYIKIRGGISYIWNNGENSDSIIVSPSTTTTYSVTVTDGNACTNSVRVTVFVRSLPDPIGNIDDSVCPGGTGFLAIEDTSTSTYYWYTDTSLTALETTGLSYNVDDVLQETTFYIARELQGCTAKTYSTATIYVHDKPVADFSANPLEVYITDSVSFSDQSSPAVAWAWYFGNGSTSSEQNPSVAYDERNTYEVTLLITNANGCKDTLTVPDYINVEYPPDIFIPTAFSPNKDLENDVFLVRGRLNGMELKVYNQWGLLLYVTTVQSEGWDGTYRGKDQPEGNYVYRFIGQMPNGSERIQNGVFTLIR